jgi:long-chain acyl-CoA synthetase
MAAIIRSGERSLTGDELAIRAERAALGFESIGIGAGDVIALFLRNDLSFYEASGAASRIGAYVAPLNWHATEAEAAYLFTNCEAKAIVIHSDLLPGVACAIPEGVAVLVVETPPEIAAAYAIPSDSCVVPDAMRNWSEWLDNFTPGQPRAPQGLSAIIYTGGTTGNPKGVRRAPPTPEQMLATYQMLGTAFGLREGIEAAMAGTPAPRICTVMTGPMYHSAPNAYGNAALAAGGEVILQPRFDPVELLEMIEKHHVTHLHMVPTMFVRLLKLSDAERARYDLSSLEFVVHAAAPCPPHVKRAMIDWWGPVINEYYGSTETSAVVFCDSAQWLSHPGTVGKAMGDAVIRVLREDGTDADVGEAGDIVCKMPSIPDFTYHGDDAKRRNAEREGLIGVGDIGYLDVEGFLFLCDRRNHMVISGGVNIYPAEIENELLKLPGVADCAVFGIPDDEFGESLCAYVQPQPGTSLDAGGVRAELSKSLARFKIPKLIEFTPELPREDSGKIFKRKLREPYWANVGRSI